jgi:hypothetical protein
MESFQHISTLISIVIGLGLTQILTNVNALIKERERVTFYWLSLYWASGTFLLQVQWWWGIYRTRQVESWDFFFFVFLILNPISMYLASGTILPKVLPDQRYDLREHYYGNRRWFFLLMACNPLLDILRKVIFAQQVLTASNIANMVPLAAFISLAFIRNAKYHTVVSLAMLGSLLYFVMTFSFHLPQG